jgi:dTDP-4-dehydrorhamnose reductase
MARIVGALIEQHPDVQGLYQLASQPIDKFDLLTRFRSAMDIRDVDVVPDDSFACDRSLQGRRFEIETGLLVREWDVMLAELAADAGRYGKVTR